MGRGWGSPNPRQEIRLGVMARPNRPALGDSGPYLAPFMGRDGPFMERIAREENTMRSIFFFLASAFLLAGQVGPAKAGVSAGIAINDDGLRSFYLSVGDYYSVPEREVIVVRERRIPDDELPVVFFLASRAHCSPSVIVDMRLGGMSWDRITLHFGLGPEIYYVPVAVPVSGPPYGNAYGYYKKWPRNQWSKIRLSDGDVVNLVNLRFISDHMGVPPHEVIKMRGSGKHFSAIHKEVKSSKGKGGGEASKGGPDKSSAKKGKGKSKGKK